MDDVCPPFVVHWREVVTTELQVTQQITQESLLLVGSTPI